MVQLTKRCMYIYSQKFYEFDPWVVLTKRLTITLYKIYIKGTQSSKTNTKCIISFMIRHHQLLVWSDIFGLYFLTHYCKLERCIIVSIFFFAPQRSGLYKNVSCSLYYKNITIINYPSRGVSEWCYNLEHHF